MHSRHTPDFLIKHWVRDSPILSKRDVRWVCDQLRPHCTVCSKEFSFVRRRHHCRECGEVVCGECSSYERCEFTTAQCSAETKCVRVCSGCWNRREPPMGAATVTGENHTCGICFDEFAPFDTRLPCGHAYCIGCVTSFLESKIDSGECGAIVCPDLDCQRILSRKFVASLVSAQKLKKFDFHHHAADPTMTLCPKPGCCGAQRTGGSRKIACQECNTTSCVKCGGAYHALPTCNGAWQVQRWSRSRDAKQCPWCRTMIEKNGGCNHMTCRNCRYQFCWQCNQPWRTHVEALCFRPNPFRIVNSTNPAFGPVAPIRAVTKTIAATASTGVIATAAVTVGAGCVVAGVVYLPYCACKGLAGRRRRRRG